MKEILKGYYRLTDEEFKELWDNCSFVFDANILLHIYRYSIKTRELFINILEELEDRIWLPHQSAYEFHERRLSVIKKQRDAYKEISDSIEKLNKQLESRYSRHPYIKIEEITKKTGKTYRSIKTLLDKIEQEHPNLMEEDPLLEKITELFAGKVGNGYEPEKRQEIIKEGERRYKEKIPPGFEDEKKQGINQFGDLVLWFQIIDKAKLDNKPIIFITDDSKEDWWKKFDGKTIGPHPALIQEMKSKANVEFYIYQGDPFIERAQEYLKQEIDKVAIDEIREIREEKPYIEGFADWPVTFIEPGKGFFRIPFEPTGDQAWGRATISNCFCMENEVKT